MKPKAYSYVRFSSPQQAKGDSYRRQTELAVKYANDHGLELAKAKEYTFFDSGKSAAKGKHLDAEGQLRRFYDLVESGDIAPGSYLLVESLDRLSREKVQKALPRFIDLLNKGVHVVTLNDGKLYRGGEDVEPSDILISLVMMMRAHEESATKGERVSARWKQKQVEARSTRKPLGKVGPGWLELVDGEYRLIPERQAVIHRVFTMAAAGAGAASICATLNADKVPTFGKSAVWSTAYMRKLLSYRALLGEYQPYDRRGGKEFASGEPIPDYYPKVFENDDLFYQVQGQVALRSVTKPTKQSSGINIWQGVAKCYECGSTMQLVSKGKPPKGYTYLTCYASRAGGCSAKPIRIEQADLAMPQLLAMIDALALVQDSKQAQLRTLTATEGRLSEVVSRLSHLADLQQEFPSRTTAQQIADLEQQQDELAALIEKTKATLATGLLLPRSEFIKQLDLVSVDGRKAANTLVKRLGITAHFQRLNLKNWCAVIMDSSSVVVGHVDHHLFTVFYRAGVLDVQVMRDDLARKEHQKGDMTEQELNEHLLNSHL